MSKFVEKTLGSLNAVLSNSGLFNNSQDKNINSSRFPSPWAMESSSFTSRLKNAESKKEEEEVVLVFVSSAKKRLAQSDVSNAEVENIVKLSMICDKLGYSSYLPFIYVHTLKLAQKGNLREKHTGYLAAASLLHPQHELIILLINTMQKDLCSSNYAEIILGLTSVCNLINAENVPNVLHLVEDKLNHKLPAVRKLAILTLGHCLRLANSQSSYQMVLPKLEKTLTDPDLDVVSAAVPTMYSIVQKLPGDFAYLIDGIIQLQDQILNRRVPGSMKHNDIPAPWLQIHILRMLSYLCKNSQQSQTIIPILKKTLLQAEVNHSIAYAIIHEAIVTVTSIESNTEMTQLVLSSISKFLRSMNSNLKFVGVEALVSVVRRFKPSIASAQQEIIMECLNQPDETLQLKTLELLYQLANSENVQAICKKLIEFMVSRKDECSRRDLALKVLHLAKIHNENRSWYISTINIILLESDHVLTSADICNIISIIEMDDTMKEIAKNTYMDMCRKSSKLSPCVIKIIAAVLSSPTEFQEFLPYLMQEADDISSQWLLVSLQETLLKTKEIPLKLADILRSFPKKSDSVSRILDQLFCMIEFIKDDDSFNFDNQQIDPSLSFLDDYVAKSLESGSSCYHPQSLRSAALLSNASTSNFKVQSISADSSRTSLTQDSENSSLPKSPTYNAISSPSISVQSFSSEMDLKSVLTSKYIWTKEGRQTVTEKASSAGLEASKKDETTDKECLELFAGVS